MRRESQQLEEFEILERGGMEAGYKARRRSYGEVHAHLRPAFDALNAAAVPVISPRDSAPWLW